jgi:hypothetical protein
LTTNAKKIFSVNVDGPVLGDILSKGHLTNRELSHIFHVSIRTIKRWKAGKIKKISTQRYFILAFIIGPENEKLIHKR